MYIEDDRWEWEAFLDDGGSGDLARVQNVKYILHPTFPDQIKFITDPQDGFVLRTSGWGEFELKAFVHFNDGTEKKLTHELQLRKTPPNGISN